MIPGAFYIRLFDVEFHGWLRSGETCTLASTRCTRASFDVLASKRTECPFVDMKQPFTSQDVFER